MTQTIQCPACGTRFSLPPADGLENTMTNYVTETRDAGSPSLERRSFEVTEIRVERAEGKPPRIVGYAATFNQPSKPLSVAQKDGTKKTFRETIAPGAFSEALGDKRDIAALVGHQMNQIIARSSADKMTLRQDEKGLAFELTPANTSRARDLLEDIDHGNIRGMSFGFGDDTKDEWALVDGKPQRTLKSIDLREISFTPFPAYDGTFVAVRSLQAIEDLEKREHPSDYSVVAEHCRSMASSCRSMASAMLNTRDVLHDMTGAPTDKEAKHVRDLHDAMKEMTKRCMDVRSLTKRMLDDSSVDGDPEPDDDDQPADGDRALRIANRTRSLVTDGLLTADEAKVVNTR